MKIIKPHSLLLALCLGASAPLVLAATDMNDLRVPGTQTQDSGHMNGNGGHTGSGTPGDDTGTGAGGTGSYDTDNTGGDDTTTGSETGAGSGNGTGTNSGGGTGGSSGSGAGGSGGGGSGG